MKVLAIFTLFLMGILAFIFIDVIAGILHFFCNHRCPHCGKRMKYLHKKYDKDGDIEYYVFMCPHCGATDYTDPIEIFREP